MRIPLTRYAVPEILLFCGFFIAATLLCLWSLPVLAVLPLCGLAFILNFFRDPERDVPGGLDVVVSPADGTVTDVTEGGEVPLHRRRPAERVGIFLSVFDVHVNRVPLRGKVERCERRPGAVSRRPRPPLRGSRTRRSTSASRPNSRDGGRVRVMIRQIAGLVARHRAVPRREGPPSTTRASATA
jgi:phosphatidylserine decarboxylase